MALHLDDVIARVEEEFPNWGWLVRNDKKHGAFANLRSPDWEAEGTIVDMETGDVIIPGRTLSGVSYPRYGTSAAVALMLAYGAAGGGAG